MWWLADWFVGALDAIASAPLITMTLLLAAVTPPAVFLHECGHALPALLLTRGEVDLQVGEDSSGVRLRAGRFRIAFGPMSTDASIAGWVRHGADRAGAAMIISAGGPFFSLLGAVLGGTLAQRATLGSFTSAAFAAFLIVTAGHAIQNLVPTYDPPSDGARLLWLWRYMRHGPPVPEDPNAATSVAPPGAERG